MIWRWQYLNSLPKVFFHWIFYSGVTVGQLLEWFSQFLSFVKLRMLRVDFMLHKLGSHLRWKFHVYLLQRPRVRARQRHKICIIMWCLKEINRWSLQFCKSFFYKCSLLIGIRSATNISSISFQWNYNFFIWLVKFWKICAAPSVVFPYRVHEDVVVVVSRDFVASVNPAKVCSSTNFTNT